jgi:hypothetical protein
MIPKSGSLYLEYLCNLDPIDAPWINSFKSNNKIMDIIEN